ncbi:MAG: hypothetical protein R3281_18625 [Balneolaceae bacterium]|nr:hypothetical protein [Balneolaceae bacterium]
MRHRKWPATLALLAGLCLNLSFFHIHQLENLFHDSRTPLEHQLTESTFECPICLFSTNADLVAEGKADKNLDLAGIALNEQQFVAVKACPGPAQNKSPPCS